MGKSKSSIEEFYEIVKGDYNLDFEEFKLICTSPFNFIRTLANSGTLRDFRLKYLCVFKVSDSKVKHYKKALDTSYSSSGVSEEHYNRKIKSIEEYEQSKANN